MRAPINKRETEGRSTRIVVDSKSRERVNPIHDTFNLSEHFNFERNLKSITSPLWPSHDSDMAPSVRHCRSVQLGALTQEIVADLRIGCFTILRVRP